MGCGVPPFSKGKQTGAFILLPSCWQEGVMTRALSHQKVKASPFLEVNHDPNLYCVEFPGGSAGSGSGVTTVAQVAAMVRVHSLALELLHVTSMAKKRKKKKVKYQF